MYIHRKCLLHKEIKRFFIFSFILSYIDRAYYNKPTQRSKRRWAEYRAYLLDYNFSTNTIDYDSNLCIFHNSRLYSGLL